MKKIVFTLAALLLAGSAAAKLPALSDEAKLKADAAKAKSAWSDKVGAYKLCQSQDKVAAHYMKAKGAKPAASAAPCQDPGPFVAPMAAAPAAAPATAVAAVATATTAPAKPAAVAAAPARK